MQWSRRKVLHFAGNSEQAANLLSAQANSASYPSSTVIRSCAQTCSYELCDVDWCRVVVVRFGVVLL